MLGSRFKKIDAVELKSAILHLDSSKITAADVTALKEFIPTKEETDTLNGFEGSTDELATPEKYFLAIKDVPNFVERLTVWEFSLNFEEVCLIKQKIKFSDFFRSGRQGLGSGLRSDLRWKRNKN